MELTKWDTRVDDVVAMAKEFVEESGYPLTFDLEATNLYLYGVICSPDASLFCVYAEDGTPAGWACVGIGREFHKEAFGYLMKFYIRKQFRGTGAARELMKEVNNYFDDHGCVCSFASSTAEIKEDALFINLLRKFNWYQHGPILRREFEA